MANLLAHFEPSELVDFMNFIAVLIHKLQVGWFYFFNGRLMTPRVEGHVRSFG
jgi:hypothetical protein